MMHKFKLKLTPRPETSSIEMDGKELHGVQAVNILAPNPGHDVARITLTLFSAQIEVDAECRAAFVEREDDL